MGVMEAVSAVSCPEINPCCAFLRHTGSLRSLDGTEAGAVQKDSLQGSVSITRDGHDLPWLTQIQGRLPIGMA